MPGFSRHSLQHQQSEDATTDAQQQREAAAATVSMFVDASMNKSNAHHSPTDKA
jgi:hypothetical protein